MFHPTDLSTEMTADKSTENSIVGATQRQPSTTTLIRPSRGWPGLSWHELCQYHELLYFLTLRNLQVRYKQTVLGIIWVTLQPLLTMAVFALFFRTPGRNSIGRTSVYRLRAGRAGSLVFFFQRLDADHR